MALVPRALRPAVVVRRRAVRQGFLGGSTFWKIVGALVFGRSTLKKIFGKNPEVIDVSALPAGRVMQVSASTPLTRRRRRKLARAGVTPLTLKEQRALAELWAASNSRRAS
jgi:hypothetical protein